MGKFCIQSNSTEFNNEPLTQCRKGIKSLPLQNNIGCFSKAIDRLIGKIQQTCYKENFDFLILHNAL